MRRAFLVERIQALTLFRELDLQATVHRLVIAAAVDGFRQVGFPRSEGPRLVVGVAIALAVPHGLEQLGGRVAQVYRHLVVRVLANIGHALVEGLVHGVALGRQRQVGDRLGQGQLPFGRAQPLLGVPSVQAESQRPGIGIADVLAGDAHQAAGHVQRIASAIEHAAQPVQGAVRIGAAHRLVQRRNLVVEHVATLVETAPDWFAITCSSTASVT